MANALWPTRRSNTLNDERTSLPTSLFPAEPRAVTKSQGLTDSERNLARLAERTFLSLWSYPNVWRDQGEGKEVADLLVVFEDRVIIFSDKNVAFQPHQNVNVAWRRWFKKAVQKSSEQVYGAERWIRDHPDRIFLDQACTQPFPIPLPSPERMRVHRVVVAHGAEEACRAHFGGGNGSLVIAPEVIGNEHLLLDDNQHTVTIDDQTSSAAGPFMIGQLDPTRGFVHVFDSSVLLRLLKTLDTVRDLLEYLARKERFIASGKLVWAAGEEDLLSHYLRNVGADGWNDFVVPEGVDFVLVPEGEWASFCQHPQRLAQLKANRISYAWDELVERFAFHILNDSQYYTTGRSVAHSEPLVRFLAREPRTRRRLLSESFLDLHAKLGDQPWKVRVMEPSLPGDPHYVFMVMRRPDHLSYEEYREVRGRCLEEYMRVLKVIRPEATDIVGIAMGPLNNDNSEDLLYLDTRTWTEDDQRDAEALQRKTGLLKNLRRHESMVKTYPDITPGRAITSGADTKGRNRNKLCPCGSGRKYKHCHGRYV